MNIKYKILTDKFTTQLKRNKICEEKNGHLEGMGNLLTEAGICLS